MVRLLSLALALWMPVPSSVALAQPSDVRIAQVRQVPKVDHHQHLLSPALAKQWIDPTLPRIEVPSHISAVLSGIEANWNEAKGLRPFYADDSLLLISLGGMEIGGPATVETVSETFGRPYQITPVSLSHDGAIAHVGAYLSRGDGDDINHFGYTLLSLKRGDQNRWRVASQSMRFPGPPAQEPLDAAELVRLLDEVGIPRAVVLSTAYALASPEADPRGNEQQLVASENNWLAEQVARFPGRLVGFCSVNPLTTYALVEIRRCASELKLRGLKLHFGNSEADVRNPSHLAKLKAVFAQANRLRLPIVAHIWRSDSDDRVKEAEIFLSELLPAAPDVVVQVAHMAGGGPGWADDALDVLAEAIARQDPRTRNLFFDIATVATDQTPAQLDLLAKRIRQISPGRILYGSDGAFAGRNPPRVEWGTFRGMVPLSDEEFRQIANNIAPYLRN